MFQTFWGSGSLTDYTNTIWGVEFPNCMKASTSMLKGCTGQNMPHVDTCATWAPWGRISLAPGGAEKRGEHATQTNQRQM